MILHPRELGQPSKTNQWDDARALDLDDHAFFAPVLSASVKGKAEHEKVFNFTYEEWRRVYRAAGERLGLQVLGPPTLYCLRHSGASLDAAWRRRTLPEIQQRGNWAQASSMKRYQKGARLTEQLLQISRSQRNDALAAAASTGETMLRRGERSGSGSLSRASPSSCSRAPAASPWSGVVKSVGPSLRSTRAGATSSTWREATCSGKCEGGLPRG